MWLFKKKKDVIDLTESQRTGILERANRTQEQIDRSSAGRVSPDGYADLTSSADSSSTNIDNSGSVDLFGAIANSSAGSTVQQRSTSTAFNNKLDDIEFKLENLRKKVDDIINRLEVIERKAGIYGS